MDRDEAIALLKGGEEGVKQWNEWRRKCGKEGLYVLPNLSGADLAGADLFKADLRQAGLEGAILSNGYLMHANLSQTNLRRADLTGANLSKSDLTKADLTGADLTRADLSGTDFNHTDLTETSLAGAGLAGANLQAADLFRANLRGAMIGQTNFPNVDLSSIVGLEAVFHAGPSLIGIDTLYKSSGKIPEIFLRGCGVPDTLIEYLPSLVGAQSALDFYSCFISFSHQDEEFCKRLHSRMRDEHLRVWYAPEDMKGGKKIREQIDSAIHVQDKLLLVLSENSMASDWVAAEIQRARQREQNEKRQVLFPIRIVPMKRIETWEAFHGSENMAREIREYHIPDFSNWKEHDAFEAAFKRLLSDLKESTEQD